ncbi:MAG TPA: hypothetical protein VFJ19_00615 [Nocardioidaceae bacterium]|nr:hypothetical protein [Nocardioidaceae bacterium]
MRTTVEITDSQHRALTAVAQRRGLRGFSQLVQEAVDAYLQDIDAGEIDLLLSLEGSIDADQEREMRTRIESVRSSWRAS